MATPLSTFREHSERLLSAITSEHDQALESLLSTREELLQHLQNAITAGEPMEPADVSAVEALEQAIGAALQERQDAIGAEFAALRPGRGPGAAYGAANAAPARYLDRAG